MNSCVPCIEIAGEDRPERHHPKISTVQPNIQSKENHQRQGSLTLLNKIEVECKINEDEYSAKNVENEKRISKEGI